MFNKIKKALLILLTCTVIQLFNVGVKALAQEWTPEPEISKDAMLEFKRSTNFGESNLPIFGMARENVPVDVPQMTDAIGDWTKLAYQTWVDDNYEVVLAMGSGANPQRLTFHSANDGRPRLNRGATKVVFTSNREGDFELFTMNIDGSDVRQLTFNGVSDAKPAWSPDGNRIVYMSKEAGPYQIFIINADGTGKTQLTFQGGGVDCLYPSWSPDGTRIAYTTWDANAWGRVWSIPANGGEITSITPDWQSFLFPSNPVWSPDGTNIAFDSANDFDYFSTNMWVVIVSSKYTTSLPIGNQVTYEDHYVGGWSPDGMHIVFNRIHYTVVGNQLYITNAFLETRCAFGLVCPRADQRFPGSGLDFQPDWQSADIIPPSSKLIPLPKYSRLTGFQATWQTWVNGLASVAGHKLEYRLNDQGEWGEWYLESDLVNRAWINLSEWQTAGDKIAFRVQAYDEAGNTEAWPDLPLGDTSTTLYTYQLNGTTMDARGYPVPAAQISVSPTPLDSVRSVDRFQIWLKETGAYSISVQTTGYGGLPITPRDPHSDLVQSLKLPPADNILVNGGFETGSLQGWASIIHTISSTVPMTVSPTVAYRNSGRWAVTLGSSCAEPCFGPSEYYGPPLPPDDPNLNEHPTDTLSAWRDMAIGEDGSIHVLNWDYSGLYAVSRHPNGNWDEPTLLEPGWASSGVPMKINVSPSGEIVAFWRSDGYRIARKPSGGVWQVSTGLPENIVGDLKDIIFDQQGGLYLLYNGEGYDDEDLLLVYRTPAGTWQNPRVVVENAGAFSATMIVGADGKHYYFWTSHESQGSNLFFQSASSTGTELESLTLIRRGQINPSRPMVSYIDKKGQIHLLFQYIRGLAHLTRFADGTWSSQEMLPTDAVGATWMSMHGNTLHVLCYGYSFAERYYLWQPEAGWFSPPLPSGYGEMIDIIEMDQNGLLHGLDRDSYTEIFHAQEDNHISLSQSVALPVNMHKPTLSFMSHWRGGIDGGNSYYDVSIIDEITTTQVLTITPSSATWQSQWVALEAWAGKTITISFTLHQEAGEPLVYLDLDDVSVGSWLTPVIEDVTPQQIVQLKAGQVITITGQNFIQKPTVYIDLVQVNASQVTWVSETTLKVVLPSSIGLGAHELKVVNAGGQVAIKPVAFRIGHAVFLPLVAR